MLNECKRLISTVESINTRGRYHLPFVAKIFPTIMKPRLEGARTYRFCTVRDSLTGGNRLFQQRGAVLLICSELPPPPPPPV
jgi:hypothetical protein